MTESDKNAHLENLLHAINHDLRTPLGNIRSATTILLQDLSTPLSEDQRIFIEIIDRSFLRLLDQSNRLLLFGQIAFGQAKLEHILLSDLLGDAKNTLKSSYEIDEVIFNVTGNPLVPCYSYALSSLLALLAAGDSKHQSETPATTPPIIQATTETNRVQFCVTSQMLMHEFTFSFTELANEIIQLHGGTLTNSDDNGRKQFSFAIPLPTLID